MVVVVVAVCGGHGFDRVGMQTGRWGRLTGVGGVWVVMNFELVQMK